ncbi:MAG: sporulation transcriptional regulator SpoIIID [Bacilli bacterium]
MNNNISKRVIKEAQHMIDTKDTIRSIANTYNISKSTVHKDLSERLIDLDKNLSNSVNEILKEHLEVRHIRGGEVTRQKYKKR